MVDNIAQGQPRTNFVGEGQLSIVLEGLGALEVDSENVGILVSIQNVLVNSGVILEVESALILSNLGGQNKLVVNGVDSQSISGQGAELLSRDNELVEVQLNRNINSYVVGVVRTTDPVGNDVELEVNDVALDDVGLAVIADNALNALNSELEGTGLNQSLRGSSNDQVSACLLYTSRCV